MAIQAWNLLGGFEWAGIPLVAEILGIVDIELLVRDLNLIRQFHLEQQQND